MAVGVHPGSALPQQVYGIFTGPGIEPESSFARQVLNPTTREVPGHSLPALRDSLLVLAFEAHGASILHYSPLLQHLRTHLETFGLSKILVLYFIHQLSIWRDLELLNFQHCRKHAGIKIQWECSLLSTHWANFPQPPGQDACSLLTSFKAGSVSQDLVLEVSFQVQLQGGAVTGAWHSPPHRLHYSLSDPLSSSSVRSTLCLNLQHQLHLKHKCGFERTWEHPLGLGMLWL